MKRWPLFEQNPALLYADWLPPESVWPELCELQQEHVRLLASRDEAGRAAAAVRSRHEAEDRERQETLKSSIRDGGAVALAGVDQAARDAEIAAATEQAFAANDALADFLGEALATIQENYEAWAADLAGQAERIEARCAEARRVLAAAEGERAELVVMRDWLDRTAGHGQMRSHFPFGQMPRPTVEEEPDWSMALGAVDHA